MEFPIEDIYLFPKLKFSIYNRKKLEEILTIIFEQEKFNGDSIIRFLKSHYDNDCRKAAVRLLGEIEITNEDKENTITAPKEEINNPAGYVFFYIKDNMTKSIIIPNELEIQFRQKFDIRDLDGFNEEEYYKWLKEQRTKL